MIMSSVILPRRNFLCSIGSLLIAAPAIVRFESIMPVKKWSYEWISTEEAYKEYIANVLCEEVDGISTMRLTEISEIIKPTLSSQFEPAAQHIEPHWYNDPPDPYADPEKLKLFKQRATVFYRKDIVETNMKPEWLVDDYGIAIGKFDDSAA